MPGIARRLASTSPTIGLITAVAWLVWIASENAIKGAISYKHPAKEAAQPKAVESKISAEQINDARRSFLTATALVATTAALKAQEKKVDGGLAIIESKKNPRPQDPDSATRSIERTRLRPALHCLPALRVGMPQRGTSPVHRPDEADAARNGL